MTIKKFQQDVLSDKSKRGWWASVVFMLLIIGLIWFLAKHEIQEKNRDILIGIIGMLTGSISSMLAIASGRDPSEVEELKDKLSASDADRAALIGRLRDCQIQLQLKNEQVFELQNAVINKLSVFHGSPPIITKNETEITLNPHIEEWLPVDREKDLDKS